MRRYFRVTGCRTIGPVAVVDLPFLARRGDDHGVRLGRALAAQLDHEAPHAGVPGREAVLIDEVLPDRHGVAAAAEGELDQLAVRLAGAGGRAPGSGGGGRVGRPAQARRDPGAEVGGHLTGRICRVGGHAMAGFGGGRRRRGSRIAMPAALR